MIIQYQVTEWENILLFPRTVWGHLQASLVEYLKNNQAMNTKKTSSKNPSLKLSWKELTELIIA